MSRIEKEKEASCCSRHVESELNETKKQVPAALRKGPKKSLPLLLVVKVMKTRKKLLPPLHVVEMIPTRKRNIQEPLHPVVVRKKVKMNKWIQGVVSQ